MLKGIQELEIEALGKQVDVLTIHLRGIQPNKVFSPQNVQTVVMDRRLLVGLPEKLFQMWKAGPYQTISPKSASTAP